MAYAAYLLTGFVRPPTFWQVSYAPYVERPPELYYGPSHLGSDSKSARDVSYNPEHHDRMKHVERRHFFIRDMVESFKIEVPFVPTENNPADLFTKAMKNASRFREFRRIVMNLPDDK